MSNTTLSVPADLKQKINKQNEKAKLFDELEELTKNSTLTDEDCLRLGNEVNERVWKKCKAEMLLRKLHSKEEQEFIKCSVELGRRAKRDRFKRLLSEVSPGTKEKLLKLVSKRGKSLK